MVLLVDNSTNGFSVDTNIDDIKKLIFMLKLCMKQLFCLLVIVTLVCWMLPLQITLQNLMCSMKHLTLSVLLHKLAELQLTNHQFYFYPFIPLY